ncbi:MAG: glycosyl hydrolase family 3 [Oscillospiraceae bacterium]|nr:glycosyl hydrolase family 3 [Oscillospiraceae bacterium]
MDLTQKPFYLNEEQIKWVNDTLAQMTDEQKAGQLFVIHGVDHGAKELEKLVSDYHIGGILMRTMPEEKLNKKWKKLDKLAAIPLLKAADLEDGGYGLNADGTYYASQMQVSATAELEEARRLATVCAVEGRRAGCNWNFAPVADIDFNPQNPITNVRSFGSDPERVCRNVVASIKTMQSYGMACACKHFPGDGVDYRDQHLHPTYNTLDAVEWYSTYGLIYMSAIEAGVLTVMAGHIVAPLVEMEADRTKTYAECLPASQSRTMIDVVLRKKLGFNGLVITDATIMGGYTMTMPRKQALAKSIMAGCDMFCFAADVYEDIGFILESIKDGSVSRERLDEAVTRILALKRKLEDDKSELPEIPVAEWRDECADKAVTLVKDTQKLIPVSAEDYTEIKIVSLGQDKLNEGGSIKAIAKEYLEANGFKVSFYEPKGSDVPAVGSLPEKRLTLLLANVTTGPNKTATRLEWNPNFSHDLPRFLCDEKCAMISFCNPYHLQDVPRIRTYINAYTATRSTIERSLEKFLGKSEFKGISPVDPFCGLLDAQL